MLVYKYNQVFSHIEKTLIEHYSKRKEYNDSIVILGYNVLDNLNHFRKKYPKHRLIIYQLEHLYTGSPWVNKKSYDNLKSCDEVWDFDTENIKWMRNNYKLDAKFKPLIYTESLNIIEKLPEEQLDIDVLYYGYLQERRAKLWVHLQMASKGNYQLCNAFGVWGTKLDEYIKRSKIVLNLHSDERNNQEQPRIYYPVINGKCVVSEKSPINYIGNSIIEEPYSNIVKKTIDLLETKEWVDVAINSSKNFKKQSFNYQKFL